MSAYYVQWLVPEQDVPYALIHWYVSKNHLFIVVIRPILNEELEIIFQSDRSDHTCFIVRYQYYAITFRYKNVRQSVRLFVYKNVPQSA